MGFFLKCFEEYNHEGDILFPQTYLYATTRVEQLTEKFGVLLTEVEDSQNKTLHSDPAIMFLHQG